jgi:hypothetical protein
VQVAGQFSLFCRAVIWGWKGYSCVGGTLFIMAFAYMSGGLAWISDYLRNPPNLIHIIQGRVIATRNPRYRMRLFVSNQLRVVVRISSGL